MPKALITKISDFISESANVRKRVVLNGYAWWYDKQNGILYDSEEDNIGTPIKHVKLTAKEREQLYRQTLQESKNNNDDKLYSKTYAWYGSFKDRYYKSEEDAKKDISRVVMHNNSQFGKILGNDDVADIISLFNFVGTTRGIKIVPKINKKREKHQIEYNTNEELVRKQKNMWEYGPGIEIGRYFSKLRYIKTSDKNIYGPEKTDEDNVKIIMNKLRAGDELPPILLDYDYSILDGHDRYEAATRLKIKNIPVIIYEQS